MAEPKNIHSILASLPDTRIEGLKQLFWSELNYDHSNQTIPTPGWDPQLTDALAEKPVLFATAGNADGFHIIYIRLVTEKLFITAERDRKSVV